VREFVSETKETVAEYSDAVSRKTRRAYAVVEGRTKDFADTNPAAIALAGVAAGLVVAALFPVTGVERDTLGPIAERASDLADQAKENAKEAAVAAGTEAIRAGLDAATSAVQQHYAATQGQNNAR
jgi:hypothetical protein